MSDETLLTSNAPTTSSTANEESLRELIDNEIDSHQEQRDNLDAAREAFMADKVQGSIRIYPIRKDENGTMQLKESASGKSYLVQGVFLHPDGRRERCCLALQKGNSKNPHAYINAGNAKALAKVFALGGVITSVFTKMKLDGGDNCYTSFGIRIEA